MKSIVFRRKMDDLGRISIPVEIRQQLQIVPGDYMDISADSTGIISIAKHRFMENLRKDAQNCADAIRLTTGFAVFVCDTEKIIASSGWERCCTGKEITDELKVAIQNKGNIRGTPIKIMENGPLVRCAAAIVHEGMAIGAVMIGSESAEKEDLSVSEGVVNMFATFLGKQIR